VWKFIIIIIQKVLLFKIQIIQNSGFVVWTSDHNTNRPSILISSAHFSPLLDTGLLNFSPSRSIFGYSHPAPASRSAQIVTPPGPRPSYTTCLGRPVPVDINKLIMMIKPSRKRPLTPMAVARYRNNVRNERQPGDSPCHCYFRH
jgi:hypothetical protein